MTVGPDVHDYASAAKFLSGGKNPRVRPTGQRGRTRFVLRENFNTIDMMYHDTVLLTYKMDGSIIIHECANWRTATTKRRMNQYLPKGHSHNGHSNYVSVVQDNWQWHVWWWSDFDNQNLAIPLTSSVRYQYQHATYSHEWL